MKDTSGIDKGKSFYLNKQQNPISRASKFSIVSKGA